MALSSILLLLLCAHPILAKSFAPWYYFCSRSGHSSIKRRDAVFAIGGTVRLTNDSTNPNYQSNGMIQMDISRQWDALGGIRLQLLYVDDNISIEPSPLISGAGIYFDDNGTDIFVYGGAKEENQTTSPTKNGLWSFSEESSSWSFQNLNLSAEYSPYRGAMVGASDQGLGFYFNGMAGDATSSLPHPRMIILDLRTKQARNVSTSAISSSEARVGAVLQYVPTIGRKGALVLIGGGIRLPSDNTSSPDLGNSMASLDSIYVLDIASLDSTEGTWYLQKTNGRTPKARAEFCAATVAAADKSSYNIYMFGGRSPDEAFDEVWVLSLPQFRWTKLFQGAHSNVGPNCHLIGKKQMLVLGGNDIKKNESCTETKIVNFDMTNIKWTAEYITNGEPYRVPKAIYEWIGGSGFGGANMTEPEGGFASEGLREMFKSNNMTKSEASMSKLRGKNLYLLVTLLILEGFL